MGKLKKLEKWFPFRFTRRKAEEKSAAGDAASSTAMQPAWPGGQPFGPFDQLARSLFNDPFFRDPIAGFGDPDRWFGDFSPSRFRPSVDVSDEDDALLVSAELPGLGKDDVDIQLQDDVLTIRGEKRNTAESRERGVYRTERSFGYFQRSIPLPGDLDYEGAEATFDSGVLTVRFPKLPESKEKTKSIPIRT